MKKSFITFIILILAFRIALFSLPSFRIDMADWMAWFSRLQQVGPPNFYSQNYFSDYFPGYLYILWFSGLLFKLLSIPINSQVFEVFIKGITTLFDVGTAYYIFKICSNYANRWKYFAPLLYLLNPAVIFNSSVWGQIDGVFTFFLISSSYFLIEKKKILGSGLLSSLGVLIKPQSLALVFVWIVWGFKKFPKTNLLKSGVYGFLIFLLLSLPFFPKNPIFGILGLATGSQNVYKYTSLYAFNFWALFDWWKPDNTTFILTYEAWGIILFGISILLIVFSIIKNKIKGGQYYLAASLSFFSFFLLLTRMHERYLFPFLAFILIASIIYKSRLLFVVYAIGSIIHFINLWFVYYHFNFVYGNYYNMKKDSLFSFYFFINNNYKIFSILMIILFISLFIYYYKSYARKS